MTTMAQTIKRLRKSAAWNQAELAIRLGVDQATVSRWENGQMTPGGDHIIQIAKVFDKSPNELLDSTAIELSFKVRVVGYVEAGAWREAMELPEADQRVATMPRPRSPSAPKAFGLEVRGDSMNQIFRDGATLACVRLADFERAPATGDYVIAVRHHRGEIEATCKQLVYQNGKPWLWPRSTDPRFQQPIPGFVTNAEHPDADYAEIYAVVIGFYTDLV